MLQMDSIMLLTLPFKNNGKETSLDPNVVSWFALFSITEGKIAWIAKLCFVSNADSFKNIFCKSIARYFGEIVQQKVTVKVVTGMVTISGHWNWNYN